jgi:signal transduction histidine kinase
VLLRRFGLVRAVGGAGYFVSVLVLFFIFGLQVWPLLLGVPVLAVVTTAYFMRSGDYPRLAVAVSLVADALVLGGGMAFLGGSGSGLVMLYAIVVVSAGIVLGPVAARWFTGLVVVLAALQLGLEQLGVEPTLLYREPLDERVPILAVSVAGLISIGYLAGVYASRLHELIVEAGAEAEEARWRGRRRRSLVRRASSGIRGPMAEVEAVATEMDDHWSTLDATQLRRLAGRLRMGVTHLQAEVDQLSDLGVMDAPADSQPEPVSLPQAVEDCLIGLAERLEPYELTVDVDELTISSYGGATRRIIVNLLENIADHTPAGTSVTLRGRSAAGYGVLAVTDGGPGVDSAVGARLFEPPEDDGGRRVGLPLVAQLCDSIGAKYRYEPAPGGGSRFIISFRLAPPGAATPHQSTATESAAASDSVESDGRG